MKLAIQGHPFKGKEVIQILENLGGKNTEGLKGTYDTFYYIDDKNEIGDDHKKNFPPTYKLYTLEEFEKEFPFKIGDKVIHSYNPNFIGTIVDIKFDDNIPYRVNIEGKVYTCGTTSLKPYEKMKEERNITLTLEKAQEWYKKGGELKEIALQAFTEKELNPLPRSWEEFWKQSNLTASWRYNIPIKYEALFKLEQLRNCWIQGWEPDWNNAQQPKYYVVYYQGKFKIGTLYETRRFLSFPTKEMAEDFLECFRDLIEQAGDLI